MENKISYAEAHKISTTDRLWAEDIIVSVCMDAPIEDTFALAVEKIHYIAAQVVYGAPACAREDMYNDIINIPRLTRAAVTAFISSLSEAKAKVPANNQTGNTYVLRGSSPANFFLNKDAVNKFMSQHAPAPEGTVKELAKKYGRSISEIRRMKAENRLHELSEQTRES